MRIDEGDGDRGPESPEIAAFEQESGNPAPKFTSAKTGTLIAMNIAPAGSP